MTGMTSKEYIIIPPIIAEIKLRKVPIMKYSTNSSLSNFLNLAIDFAKSSLKNIFRLKYKVP